MQEYTFDTVIVGTAARAIIARTGCTHSAAGIFHCHTRALSGASRNTGSDKQTYYKLSLASGMPDSVRKMQGISARAVASTQASRSRKRQAAHAAL